MTNATLYLVGGAVRDHYRDAKSKDIDFAVEADSFDDMRDYLNERDFEIFTESERYFTIRARAPKGKFQFGNFDMSNTTFDFTLTRKERDYTDGRHPDIVEMGDIYDDLSRRDFTMNAIAIDSKGKTIDPFNGVDDIYYSTIKCVGGTERLVEDGLRIIRALRFNVQLGFLFDSEVHDFMYEPEAVDALRKVSQDRVRQELAKALKIDPMATLRLLNTYHKLGSLIFDEMGIWLEPTSKNK